MKGSVIDYTLNKLKNKIWINNIVKCIVNGILILSISVFLFIVFAHFKAVVYVPYKILLIASIMFFISLIIGIIRKPSLKVTAKTGDSLGFKERFITYLEFKKIESNMIDAFKEELEESLEDKNVLKEYKVKISLKKIIISLMIFVVSFGVYFIPTASRQEAINKEFINKEIKEEKENIDRVYKQVEEKYRDGEEKKQILSVLKDLEKNIDKTYNYNEAAANIAEAEKKIESVLSKSSSNELKALSGLFKGNASKHKELSDALNSGELERAANIAENKEFTKEEQKSMLDNLNEALKNEKDSDTKESLNQIKTDLENQSLTGNKLKKAIEKAEKNKKLAQEQIDKDFKLQQMKDKFFAKSEKEHGMKAKSGESKMNSFSMGDTSKSKSGEESNMGNSEKAAGGSGNKKMDSPEGVGGGKNKASGKGNEEKKFDSVSKKHKATSIGENENSLSKVTGKSGSSGQVQSKKADEVISQNGEIKYMTSQWSEFKRNNMDYISKYKVPMEEEDMVVEYFKQLNGGNINGK